MIIYTGYFRKSHHANWWLTCNDRNLDRCKLLLGKTLDDARKHYPEHSWEGIIIQSDENNREDRQAEFPCNHNFGDKEIII